MIGWVMPRMVSGELSYIAPLLKQPDAQAGPIEPNITL